MVSLGGNIAAAFPDRALIERGRLAARLTVHVSTKLNRSHLVPGGSRSSCRP
ncbi:MAG: hypothetical protein R2705_09715 [Ilumatobacteraceae bacterium]